MAKKKTSWDELTMSQRSEYFKLGLRFGMSVDDIKQLYNSYKDGGELGHKYDGTQTGQPQLLQNTNPTYKPTFNVDQQRQMWEYAHPGQPYPVPTYGGDLNDGSMPASFHKHSEPYLDQFAADQKELKRKTNIMMGTAAAVGAGAVGLGALATTGTGATIMSGAANAASKVKNVVGGVKNIWNTAKTLYKGNQTAQTAKKTYDVASAFDTVNDYRSSDNSLNKAIDAFNQGDYGQGVLQAGKTMYDVYSMAKGSLAGDMVSKGVGNVLGLAYGGNLNHKFGGDTNSFLDNITASLNKLGSRLKNKITSVSNTLFENNVGKASAVYNLNSKGTDVIDLSKNVVQVQPGESADGILFNDYIEKYSPTPKEASFYQNATIETVGDKNIPISNFNIYGGIENGTFKLDSASHFDPNTVIFPTRNISKNQQPVKELIVKNVDTTQIQELENLKKELEANPAQTTHPSEISNSKFLNWLGIPGNVDRTYTKIAENFNEVSDAYNRYDENAITNDFNKFWEDPYNITQHSNPYFYKQFLSDLYPGGYDNKFVRMYDKYLNHQNIENQIKQLETSLTDINSRGLNVVTVNGDTIPMAQYSPMLQQRKLIIGNPNGGLFVGDLGNLSQEQLDNQINPYLQQNPSWLFTPDLGFYNEYATSDIEDPDMRDTLQKRHYNYNNGVTFQDYIRQFTNSGHENHPTNHYFVVGVNNNKKSTGGPLYPFSFEKNPYFKTPIVRYDEGGHLYGLGDLLINLFSSKGATPTTVNTEPVPLDFSELAARQAYAESKFDSNAVSPANAIGLFQITPTTLDYYNQKTGSNYTSKDLYNDVINQQVRDWYMNDLMTRPWNTKNNPSDSVQYAKSLGAYNWGPTNLVDTLNKAKADGVDIYNSWDWLPYLPTETRDYINFILRNQNNSSHRNNPMYNKSVSKNQTKVATIKSK